MENYKVGDLKRYGLDYETDQGDQPRHHLLLGDRLRPDRPLRARAPATTRILQAMGGLMSVTGHIDGEPARAR